MDSAPPLDAPLLHSAGAHGHPSVPNMQESVKADQMPTHRFAIRLVWPCLLLAASLVRVHLASFLYLIAFALHQLAYMGAHFRLRHAIVISCCLLSGLFLLVQTIFQSMLASQAEVDPSGSTLVPAIVQQLFALAAFPSVLDGFLVIVPSALLFLTSIFLWKHGVYLEPDLFFFYQRALVEDAAVMRRKTRRAHFILAVLMVLILTAVSLCACLAPNILAYPYLLYLFVETASFASVCNFKPVTSVARPCLVLYNLVQVLLLYVFQCVPVYNAVSAQVREMFGLFVMTDSNISRQLYTVAVLILFILWTMHALVAKRFHVPFRGLSGFSTDLGIRRGFARHSPGKASRLYSIVSRNPNKIAAVLLLVFAITFPSYLTLPMLLFACVVLTAPLGLFQSFAIYALHYFSLVLICQYTLNLEGFIFPALPDIGKTYQPPFPFFELGLFLHFLFAVTCSPVMRRDVFIPAVSRNPRAPSISVRSQTSIQTRLTLRQRWDVARDWFASFWTTMTDLILRYAYLISLTVIYICGLQEVNVINAVFLVYFILFLIFPKLARLGWTSLVLYTEVVIIMQFLWQMSFARNDSNDKAITENERLWGLRFGQNLWFELRYHLTILFFAVLQMNAYEQLLRRNRSSPDEAHLIAKTDKQEYLGHVIGQIYQLGRKIVVENMQLACYVAFAAVGLVGPVTFFDLGYLCILAICLLLHQLDAKIVLRVFWVCTCLYPGSIATACYLYQFSEIQHVMKMHISQEMLADIGLFAKTGGELFEYLLRPISALLLCVFQFRIYRTRPRCPPLRDMISWSWVFVWGDFFQRLAVIHWHKMIAICVFFSSIWMPSAVGFVTLVYVCYGALFKTFASSHRPLFLLWMQFIVLSRLVFQLQTVQRWVGDSAFAGYMGYQWYPPPTKAASKIILDILAVFVLALQPVINQWKSQQKRKHHDFPAKESEWPWLTPIPSNSEDASTTISMVESVNFWFSNWFNKFGFEICVFVNVAVIMARMDVIGLLYLVWICVFLAIQRERSSVLWWAHLVFCCTCMLLQYISAIGLPPMTAKLPWTALPSATLYLLGLPIIPGALYITADFFVIFFCALQYRVYQKERRGIEGYQKWVEYEKSLNDDFTERPRFGVNQIKYLFVRHWIWVSTVLTYAAGTIEISGLSFVYLSIALYLITSGESILLNRPLRTRACLWQIGYSLVWLSVQNAYQIPAYLIPVENNDISSFSSDWQRFLGVEKLSRNPDYVTSSPVWGSSNITVLLLFACLLIQARINASVAAYHMAHYIKRDSDLSRTRVEEYTEKKNRVVENERAKYETEIALIRKKVVMARNGLGEVTDWVALFGARQDDCGYAIVDEIVDSDGTTQWDVVTIDPDDGFHTVASMLPSSDRAISTAIEAHITEISPRNQAILPVSTTTRDATIDQASSQDLAAQEISNPKKTLTDAWSEAIIRFLLSLATNYTDLYVTTSNTELAASAVKVAKLRGIFKALVYVLLAHTQLIAFIAVYVNQIYHGNVFSTIPMLVVLLVGMCRRPYPGRRFWQSLIVFTEVTIFIKYFFQFDVWTFNKVTCPMTTYESTAVVIIGIEKSCSSFLIDVLPELFILLTCIAHRGVMRRLGLWSYRVEEEVDDEYYSGSSDGEMAEYMEHDAELGVTNNGQIDEDDGENFANEDDPEFLTAETSLFYRGYDGARNFARSFTDTSHLPGKDFYFAIFVCDFLVFFLTIFFWTSFSGDSANNSSIEFLNTVFSQNTVPPLFVGIAMVNFTMLILDRAIYISKSLFAKFVVQYVTVLAFNIWLFFVLPRSNNEPFSQLQTLQIWYFVKCAYWYFSGLQIKNGYPRFRLYNFFMRQYDYVSSQSYAIYRMIPFVWELRSVIDWTLSDTSFPLYNWLKFEDIFANLYFVKCNRLGERKSGRRFGEKQGHGWKYGIGGLILVALVILLWFPLLLLSIPGTTKPDPVGSVRIQLSINGFEPFYVQAISGEYIRNYTEAEFEQIRSVEKYQNIFASYYSAGNLQGITLQTNSMNIWPINPPSKRDLVEALSNFNFPLFLSFSWEMVRENSIAAIARGESTQAMSPDSRMNMSRILNGTAANGEQSVRLQDLFPKFIHAYPAGQSNNLVPGSFLATGILRYRQLADNDTSSAQSKLSWWELAEDTDEGMKNPSFDILSDNIPAISSISSYGIIGLYVAVVFAAGQFIRLLVTDLTLHIMYQDLPNPDPVLEMCSGVILAREFGDYETEETLYWQLITLFRSPMRLFDMTRLHQ